eukprot:Phypoly_transcript_15318.p1 GENE.Phypoly_transcript_15318~~Phypoly_transcript_15318.p1  ORF type:complete len:163 (-),score=25.59 Phypoly_transcript_15318:254-742(-)
MCCITEAVFLCTVSLANHHLDLVLVRLWLSPFTILYDCSQHNLPSLSEKSSPKLVSLLHDTLLSSKEREEKSNRKRGKEREEKEKQKREGEKYHPPFTPHSLFQTNPHIYIITETAIISLFNLLELHLPILHTITHLATSLTHPDNKTHPNIVKHNVTEFIP